MAFTLALMRWPVSWNGFVVHDRTDALAWSLLIATLFSCVIALAQLAGFAHGLEPWVASSDGVGFANLRQRNQFASLTVFGWVALIYLVRTGSVRAVDASRLSATSISTLAVLMLGNAASASRTGLNGLVLIVLISLGWRQYSLYSSARLTLWLIWLALPLYALAALVLLATGIAHETAFTRLAQVDDPCSSRLTLWSNVLHLIAERPWTGWGWGELSYAHFVTLYPGSRFCAILDNAHNLPLHLAVTLGIPAAVVVCGVFLRWVIRRRPWAETDAARQMAWSLLAMLLLHSLLEYPLWYGPFQMVAVACALILWPLRAPERAQNLQPVWRVKPNISALKALFFIASLAYMVWDYSRISQIYLSPQERSAAYRDDTLRKIKGSWLFQSQVEFAELAITPLTPDNAHAQYRMATALLHFSPEPLVIERVIASARWLGMDAEVAFHQARYQAAFPEAYLAWLATPQNALTSPRASPAASPP